MEEPAVQNNVLGKPTVCQQQAGERTHQPRRKTAPDVESPFFLRLRETLSQKTAVRFKKFRAIEFPRGENRLRSQQARFDRRTNALATLRIRQTGGVADQENAVLGNVSLRMPVQEIRMPPQGRWQVKRNLAGPLQKTQKAGHMARQCARVQASQPYI